MRVKKLFHSARLVLALIISLLNCSLASHIDFDDVIRPSTSIQGPNGWMNLHCGEIMIKGLPPIHVLKPNPIFLQL